MTTTGDDDGDEPTTDNRADNLVKRLLQRYPDAWVREHDGHVIRKREGADGEMYRQDLTHLFQNAPRTTSHVKHLVIEARLADEKGTVGNPAVPIDAETEEAARERIEREGLEPAWEHPDASHWVEVAQERHRDGDGDAGR